MKRQVTIQPNLVEWLKKYPFKPFKPSYVEYHRSKLTKRFSLSHDVMRHTYISMFVAKYRSMGEAALQAGNSESIIRKHYLDLKTPAEAENYFNIVPGQREEATEKKNDNALSPCKRSAGDLVGVGAERW